MRTDELAAGRVSAYPKDGTYEGQFAWVRERGYPEDGSHEEQLAWVRAHGQLPPYPRHGTPLEKNAWARLSTAYLTDTADTKWDGDDLSEPLLEVTVNRRGGELVGRRLVPREPRRARRAARTVGARGDPDSSEPPPRRLYELGRLDAASSRLWHHVRRREARQRLAAW